VRKLRTTLMTVTATTYYRVVRDTRNKCASWLVFFSSCRVSPLPELDHFCFFFFLNHRARSLCSTWFPLFCRWDGWDLHLPTGPTDPITTGTSHAAHATVGAPTRSVHLANVFFSPSQNKQALQQ
jgi:hypothetical protein